MNASIEIELAAQSEKMVFFLQLWDTDNNKADGGAFCICSVVDILSLYLLANGNLNQ